MAALALPLIKPILDAILAASVAGATAKTTKDVAEKIKEEKHIKDTAKALSEKEKPKYKTLSRAEKDEILITLAEGGLSTREVIEVLKTGHISNDQLKRIPIELRRKIARITGQDLEAQLGLGGPDDNGDDDGDDDGDENDKAKKNEEKREKIRELKKNAEDEQRKWKKKEDEFLRNDPKSKRISDAKKGLEKSRNEALTGINKKDPKYLGNSAEQKMKMGAERMKRAIENGTGPQWEYQHVTPTSNPPVSL